MLEDYTPPTKADLVVVISTERARFENILDGLSEAQMTLPGVEGFWSIKDILAHIAAWERLAYDRVHAAVSGEALKFPLIKGDDDVNAFNADVYKRNKSQPLVKIISEFHESHQEFSALIESLDEEFLSKPLPFDWAGKLTAQVVISANTHWHYLEHIESINRWLKKQE